MSAKGLFTYTTEIGSAKTVGEIHGELAGHGAKSIMSNYNKDGDIESISFIIDTPYGTMCIKLPCNPDAVLEIMRRKKAQPRYLTRKHALEVAWRMIYYWVKAQMAILETDMVKMEQIFLPYIIVNKSGKTLYENMLDTKFQITDGR
jgi:hypothetical protein